MWGVFRKPHTTARWALVTRFLLSAWWDWGMLGGNSALGGVNHLCPSQLSSSRTWDRRKHPQSMAPLEKGWPCFYFAWFHYSFWREESCYMKGIFSCGTKVAVVQGGSHHSFRKVAICAIVLVQPYKIRPSNSSQSEDRKRETKPRYILL